MSDLSITISPKGEIALMEEAEKLGVDIFPRTVFQNIEQRKRSDA
ncbi:hypothetical protein ACFONN_16880 [Dyella humi]